MAAPGSSSYAPVFSTQHSKTTARKVRENQNSSAIDRPRPPPLDAVKRLAVNGLSTAPGGELTQTSAVRLTVALTPRFGR